MKRLRVLAALCLSLGSAALAQTVTPAPSLLSYQGRIAKPDGTPVPDPSSTFPYTIRLSLWDAATGGNKKWEQVLTVQTKNGVFAALLDLSVGGTNGLTADQILAGNVWMETKIGNDATLSPRQQIVSVAYALKANTVPDNAITTAKIADGSITAAKLANGVGGGLTLPFAGTVSTTADGIKVTNNGNMGRGIFGVSLNGDGVGGYSTNGVGVYGVSIHHRGMVGTSEDKEGIVGQSISSHGVHGISTSQYGVYGESTNDDGVHGVSVNGAGIYGTSINFYAGYFDGTVLATRGFYDSSDARYKTNINPLENPLATILNMRGVSYDWKRDKYKDMNFGKGRQIGFIAQELEKVLPELVHTDSKGYKSVNYSHVVPVLVEAVKAQQAQINRLSNAEKKNIELEARIRQLEAMMERLNADKQR